MSQKVLAAKARICVNFYNLNREERHFGFLWQTLILGDLNFRSKTFSKMKELTGITLDPHDFNLYAEVALFRDYWFSLGDQAVYSDATHGKRISFLKDLFSCMSLTSDLIGQYGLFWTGTINESKLWFPGKWAKSEIQEIETAENILEKRLFRCRWLCNAKPDVMITSGNRAIFIEIKLESGLGSGDDGYEQAKTQTDIVALAGKVLPFLKDFEIAQTVLTANDKFRGLSWTSVVDDSEKIESSENAGIEMIKTHLRHLPKSEIRRKGILS